MVVNTIFIEQIHEVSSPRTQLSDPGQGLKPHYSIRTHWTNASPVSALYNI